MVGGGLDAADAVDHLEVSVELSESAPLVFVPIHLEHPIRDILLLVVRPVNRLRPKSDFFCLHMCLYHLSNKSVG